MRALGELTTIDAIGALPDMLNDQKLLEKVLERAIKACGATIFGVVEKQFIPSPNKSGDGVTIGILIGLGESHASIHTYPEHGAYMVDIFLCGGRNAEPAVNMVVGVLGGHCDIQVRPRGVLPESMIDTGPQPVVDKDTEPLTINEIECEVCGKMVPRDMIEAHRMYHAGDF